MGTGLLVEQASLGALGLRERTSARRGLGRHRCTHALQTASKLWNTWKALDPLHASSCNAADQLFTRYEYEPSSAPGVASVAALQSMTTREQTTDIAAE